MSHLYVSKNKTKLERQLIHEFLTNSYWAKGRTPKEVQISIQNSTCYGLYKDDKQIGFARLITDSIVFAYIMDVFVIEEERGQGFASVLIDHILGDESLKRVSQWYLKTQDAHGFYKKFGFGQLKKQEWFMERVRL